MTADSLSTTLYDAAKVLGDKQQGLGPAALRRVKVLSWDGPTMTGTVSLNGDDTVPVPVRAMNAAAVPVVGALGWAMQNDTDLVLTGTDPPVGTGMVALRSGTIESRDAVNKTCSILLDGDGSPVTASLMSTSVVPIVDATGWAFQIGATAILAGVNAELPKIRVRSTSTSSSVTTETNWSFSVGAVEYDTDFDGTNTMYDSGPGCFKVRWPGKYAFGARGFVTASAIGVLPVARLRLNSTTYIDAWQDAAVSGGLAMHFGMHNQREFAVDDIVQLMISSAGGSSTFGTNSHEIGMTQWMHYLG